jgi:hypothetical protein
LALSVSALLLLWVALSDVGFNVLNFWTIALCAFAGVLAWEVRPGWAVGLLAMGAAPALIGGIGFLYLPSLLLVGLAGLTCRPAATSH